MQEDSDRGGDLAFDLLRGHLDRAAGERPAVERAAQEVEELPGGLDRIGNRDVSRALEATEVAGQCRLDRSSPSPRKRSESSGTLWASAQKVRHQATAFGSSTASR